VTALIETPTVDPPDPRRELAEVLRRRTGWYPEPGGRYLRRVMLSGKSFTATRWVAVDAVVRPVEGGFEVRLVRRWTSGGWGNQRERGIGTHSAEDALAAVLTAEGQLAAVALYDSGSVEECW
jgi:hypothetical protein